MVFMTDDIIRVRVSFDRAFKEESYTLVTTAWPDRMDGLLAGERKRIKALDVPCEESEKALTFRTRTLKLVMRKCPLSFQLYSADGQLIYADLKERAFEKDQLGRLSHYSRIDYAHDHFYGFGEKTGHLDKKGRRMRMAPKDAIGHDPETGDPMYTWGRRSRATGTATATTRPTAATSTCSCSTGRRWPRWWTATPS